MIEARAVVSDVVVGQGGQTVDTLESEGQLGKGFPLLAQRVQTFSSHFCLTVEGRTLFPIISKR